MKLDCVLTAVNEKQIYIDFIPFFIKAWKKLYPLVDIKIILVADKIPDNFLKYKNNIILFKPLDNIFTAYISQYIRLLYPCILKYKNGVLITDIDMIPMNKTYYTVNIEKHDNDKFIYFRENICLDFNQISMCYNVALPKIWSDIFSIKSIDDINNRLKDVFRKNTILEGIKNKGWGIDQVHLYSYVINWNNKTNNFVCLNEKETKFNRLNRHTFNINNFDEIGKKIKKGKFTDYHCYRPFNKYKKINNLILSLL